MSLTFGFGALTDPSTITGNLRPRTTAILWLTAERHGKAFITPMDGEKWTGAGNRQQYKSSCTLAFCQSTAVLMNGLPHCQLLAL